MNPAPAPRRGVVPRWWRWLWRGSLGRLGESIARRHLKRLGYYIARTNLRLTTGELDILATKPGLWVAVEVRTRTANPHVGISPEQTVNRDKQRKVVCCAREWWYRKGCPPVAIRFDVIAIEVDDEWTVLRFEHIERAFDPPNFLR